MIKIRIKVLKETTTIKTLKDTKDSKKLQYVKNKDEFTLVTCK